MASSRSLRIRSGWYGRVRPSASRASMSPGATLRIPAKVAATSWGFLTSSGVA